MDEVHALLIMGLHRIAKIRWLVCWPDLRLIVLEPTSICIEPGSGYDLCADCPARGLFYVKRIIFKLYITLEMLSCFVYPCIQWSVLFL